MAAASRNASLLFCHELKPLIAIIGMIVQLLMKLTLIFRYRLRLHYA